MRSMMFGRTVGGVVAVCGLSAAVLAGPPVRVSFTGGQMTGSGNPTNIPQNFAMVTMGARGGSGGGTTGGGLPCAAITTPMAISISDAPTSTTIALRGVLSHGTNCPASSSATANYFTSFANPPTFTLREPTSYAVTNASTFTADGQAAQAQNPVTFRRLGVSTPLASSGVLSPGQYTLEFNIGAGNQGSMIVENRLDWQVQLERVDTGLRDALDYDGDGQSDFFLHNRVTGSTLIYSRFPNAGINGFETLGEASTIFTPVASADFDRDNRVDLLWRNNADGSMWVWYTRGRGGNVDFKPVPIGSSTAFRVAGVGDFDGDLNNDICFSNPDTGLVAVWFMDHNPTTQGPRYLGWAPLATLPAGWSVKTVADMNNDGAPDLICANSPVNGQYQVGVVYTDGLSTPAWQPLGWAGSSFTIVGASDIEIDGFRDILFQPSTGTRLASWNFRTTSNVYQLIYMGWSEVDLGLSGNDWVVRN